LFFVVVDIVVVVVEVVILWLFLVWCMDFNLAQKQSIMYVFELLQIATMTW